MPPKSKDNLTNRGEQASSRLEIIQQMESSKLEVDEQLIAPVAISPRKPPTKQKKVENSSIVNEEINESNIQRLNQEKK
jgi:hypothetical protein